MRRKILHPSKIKMAFQTFAEKISRHVASPIAFFFAILIVVVWVSTGPYFDFSEKWQLIINSFTTIVTFLMVFLIQNTQNRELNSIHLKLDALLKKAGIKSSLLDIEDLSDEEREQLKEEYKRLYLKYSERRRKPREPKSPNNNGTPSV